MSADSGRNVLVREWVQKAESDLQAATLALKAGEDCPADTVCFHAQQCVEKYFKAYLELNQVAFRRTHDLQELAAHLPPPAKSPLAVSEHDRLTAYAMSGRYPGFPDIPARDARKAVALSRRVRREIRRHLPRAVLVPHPRTTTPSHAKNHRQT